MAVTQATRWNTLAAAAIAAYGFLLLWYGDTRIMPGLDADRYAFMECLVERGSFQTDKASVASVDRIKVGNHFYSGKPPVLNFLGAGLYWLLFHGPEWSFHQTPAKVVTAMKGVFVAIPLCLLLWFVWLDAVRLQVLRRGNGQPDPEDGLIPYPRAALVVLLVAAASIVPVYGLIFTNHPLAALLLYTAWSCARGDGRSPEESQPPALGAGRLWAAGFLAALSATVDLIPGAVFAAAFPLAAARSLGLRRTAAFACGAAVPLGIHLALNYLTLGVLTPSYLIRDAFQYEGSVWTGKSQEIRDYDQFPTYASALYHYLLGHRGAIWYMPLMLAGAVYILRNAGLRRRVLPARAAADAAIFAVFVSLLLLVPRFSMGLGGSSYGPRHLLPVVAPLYLALVAVPAPRMAKLRRTFTVAAAAWSAAIAAIGIVNPWPPHVLSVYGPLDTLAVYSAGKYGQNPFLDWTIMATSPSPAFAFAEAGYHCAQNARVESAAHYYLRSLAFDAERVQTLYVLGELAGRTGQDELAETCFRRVIKLEPENSGAWANLGLTILGKNPPEASRQALERGLALNPSSRAAAHGLELWHRKFGDAGVADEYRARFAELIKK